MPAEPAPAQPAPAVMWFRRDLRLADNPALLAAGSAAAGNGVLALFVIDPLLWAPSGPSRRAYLCASLSALDDDLDGQLCVLRGDPVSEVVRAARRIDASTVHVAADFGPYGQARDASVEKALADEGIELRRLGSPYAVAPGRVVNGAGHGYQVFTPYSKAWADHGWRPPVDAPPVGAPPVDAPPVDGPSHGEGGPRWLTIRGERIPSVTLPGGLSLPEAGEQAARRRWRRFLDEGLLSYDTDRDRPDRAGTSAMSVHLKWGEIHPRTMLADIGGVDCAGSARFRTELAWREFYADVLSRRPETARDYLRPEFATMEYDDPGDRFDAWRQGRTGFPIVDAGMRQLRATGWMHNRVRMIVASFLVKDLHLEWQHGARHFMRWLVDGDLASNQHGWQWVAGCGTDAAPYFRVFNPTTQGSRFDPSGDYVRRWVRELRAVDTRYVHDPSKDPSGLPNGYPAPIVEHGEERQEALARLERMRQRAS